jgi:polyisoprenoid-binding protein YceI
MRTWFVLSVFSLVVACKSELDNKPSAGAKEAPRGAQVAPVAEGGPAFDASASKIEWVGSKVSLDHAGSFEKFTASITLDGDKVTSLQIAVDPASVAVEPEKLREHLIAPDFFDVAKYPSAGFSSTKITEGPAPATHTIEGLLELRGVTKTVSFPANITIDAKTAKGTAEFKINRKDFGIEYPGKPDDLIKDEVLLKIALVFNR